MKLLEKLKSVIFAGCDRKPIEGMRWEKPTKILYLCDRLKCEKCSYPNCRHTTDIYHARNFERIDDIFVEGTTEEDKETKCDSENSNNGVSIKSGEDI